jgi:dTDP-6-deoxy-L-talose 4-dehydrogenase (NAD+)
VRAYTVVTGAAGFVGRAVLPRLAAEVPPGRVVGLDLRPRPPGWGGEWLEGGLERLRELDGPFVAVHLAWDLRRGDAGAQEASLAAFREMLRLPNLAGLVGMGSAEEYGSAEGRLEEGMAPGSGLSAYGRAKHEALRAAQAAGVRCVWLRPFIIYGEGQGGNMVVPYALRCAREGTVAEFSSGEQFRDFVHVDDVAGGIAAAIRALGGLREGECRVCNLGRGEPVRVRDVLEHIARRTGREELFRFGVRPMRAGEPSVQFAATEAAETALGWKAAIPWREGIDRLCMDLEKAE